MCGVGSALHAALSGNQRALCWAAQALCRAAGEVVDATLKALNKDPEDDPPLDVVAGLYCDRTAGDVPPPPLRSTPLEVATAMLQRSMLHILVFRHGCGI